MSNPPYVSVDDWNALSDEVLFWEDKNALVAENHGLAIYTRIIAAARGFLRPSGPIASHNVPQIVFEIGYDQGGDVASMLQEAQFKNVTVHKDLELKERWVSARRA